MEAHIVWITRSDRFVDKKLVEEGHSQTILTLPLLQQQTFLLTWFDHFISKGSDCPNIQKEHLRSDGEQLSLDNKWLNRIIPTF